MKKTRQIKKISVVEDSDGSLVTYYPNWLPFKKSLQLYDKLVATLPVGVKYVCVAGRTLAQPRLTSWHGDGGKTYTYSGLTVVPESWTEELAYLRDELQEFLGIRFNSVLANYYRDGNDSIGAHSDAEDELGPEPHNKVIASISFGEARNFVLRHKRTKQVIPLDLQFGSLLVMAGTTQRNYTHEISKTKKEVKSRLNLTYRVII